jgi:hypothetical protein
MARLTRRTFLIASGGAAIGMAGGTRARASVSAHETINVGVIGVAACA